MSKQAKKATGGKWAEGAFPKEASLQYDEVAAEDVMARVAAAEQELQGEEWEVVDGFSFPYAQCA